MEGYIRKRGRNSWQIIFDLPRGADARRRQASHTAHGTKRDAQTKLRYLLNSIDKGDYVTPKKETVEQFLSRWLDTYVTANASRRTQKDYRGLASRYLIASFGYHQLTSLRPEDVQSLYAEMLTRGLSPLTVLHVHRLNE